MELVAFLPWWGALCVGLGSYAIFHALSHPPHVTATRLDQMGGVLAGSLIAAVASFLQYIVPLLCIAAAVMSAAGRRRRVALVSRVVSSNAPDALEQLTWQEFELLVGEGYRLQGFQVEERGGGRPDGGVDLIVRKDGEKLLVQCKHWKSLKVSVPVVRELFGVMAATGAAGGHVVTSGVFTQEAAAFASGRNIHLVNGSKLTGLLRQARSRQRTDPAEPATADSASPSTASATSRLACPDCAGPMLSKRARRGPNAGGLFWGCAAFPDCKGTRPA